MTDRDDAVAEFIEAACVPRHGDHGSGTLEQAESLLASHPGVARQSVFTAAILGDDEGVRRFLAQDPVAATATGGPWSWDALTYLCFSRFLRLDRSRAEAFVRAAEALLDAGASAKTGWFEDEHHAPR